MVDHGTDLQVSGFGDKANSLEKGSSHKDRDSRDNCEEASILSAFRALFDMIQSLTNNNGDGRIIISRPRPTPSGQQGGYLKYVMLTGEKIFSEVRIKLNTKLVLSFFL